jgi:DNA-binding CsgD family transcriptional regulator
LGDVARSRTLGERAVPLYRAAGSIQLLAGAIENLGIWLADDGDFDRAVQHLEEALALRRSVGHKRGIATSLGHLTDVALAQGDLGRAACLILESLGLHSETGDAAGVCDCITQIGSLVGWPLTHPHQGIAFKAWSLPAESSVPVDRLISATRLIAAAEHRRAGLGNVLEQSPRQLLDDNLARLRTALGKRTYSEAWALGAMWPPDFAAGVARAAADQLAGAAWTTSAPAPAAGAAPTAAAPAPDTGGLTPRELEVAALVAAGLTYAEMAERLSLSVKSIEKHMGSILAKLDAKNRRDVAVWARARGLGG